MTGDGRVTTMTQHAFAGDRAGRERPVVHRVTTSTAAVVDDPTREDLAQLLDEVARSGRGSFLIAQCRRVDDGHEAYLQAVRVAGGWVLEASDDATRHVRAEVADSALVEDVMMWWTHNLPAWRRLPWQPVARDQQWLTSA